MKIPKVNQKTYTEGQLIQWPKDKGQNMIYKTPHGKSMIAQHEPDSQLGLAVPDTQVTPVILLINDTDII